MRGFGDIVITAALAAVLILIIRKLIKDKKKGIGSCGGNCEACLHSGEGGCSGGFSSGEVLKDIAAAVKNSKEEPPCEILKDEAPVDNQGLPCDK